jgi:hypothetical protein
VRFQGLLVRSGVLLVLAAVGMLGSSASAFAGEANLIPSASSEQTLSREVPANAAVAGRSTAARATTSLGVTALTQSSISLTWTAARGARFSLRRTNGISPASRRSQGRGVRIKGLSATDTHLEAGSQYSYALFIRVHGRWRRPVTIVASTTPAPGSKTAAYVLSPGTLVPGRGEVVSEKPTGTGVRVTVRPGAQLPTASSIVVLPASASLPGGYIGKAASVSGRTRSFTLLPAALGDAFDYYQLDIPNISTSPATLTPIQATHANVARVAPLPDCDLSGGAGVSFSPSLTFGGHYVALYSHQQIAGLNVPTGVTLNAAVTATLSWLWNFNLTGALSCGVSFPAVVKTIGEIPLGVAGVLPIQLKAEPTAEMSADGGTKVSNLGGSTTLGVEFSGSLNGLDLPFSVTPIAFTSPSTPDVTQDGSVSVTVGGQVTIGPGVGNANVGVIAGLTGELDLVKASLEPVPEAAGSTNTCVELQTSAYDAFSLTASAWLPHVNLSHSITLVHATVPEAGSPWYFPTGCEVRPTLSPATASIPAGQSQTYTVEGFDTEGKDLGPVTEASLSISPDGTCDGYTCTADVPGSHVVTATTKFAKTTAQLTVTPASLDHMQISPQSSTIPVGTSQPYTVEGFDRFGNDLGPVTRASLSISPDGTCDNTAHTCTATEPGTHTVTATLGTVQATATLTAGTTGTYPIAFTASVNVPRYFEATYLPNGGAEITVTGVEAADCNSPSYTKEFCYYEFTGVTGTLYGNEQNDGTYAPCSNPAQEAVNDRGFGGTFVLGIPSDGTGNILLDATDTGPTPDGCFAGMAVKSPESGSPWVPGSQTSSWTVVDATGVGGVVGTITLNWQY